MRNVFGAPLEQMSFACLYGTPDQWVDMVGRFGEAGARQVLPVVVTDNLARDVDLIVEKVLPQLDARPSGLVGV
jgi:hypothetical protein